MKLRIGVLVLIMLFPFDALAQKAEIFNLEKLYDPQPSHGEFVSWKNDGTLIPVRYESKNSGRVEVSFSGLDADFQLYLLHEVLADFSAGNCGTDKEKGTFEDVMVPDRAEQKPDLTFDADGEGQWLLVRIKPKSNSIAGKFPFVISFSQNTSEVRVKGSLSVKNRVLEDLNQLDFYSDFWQFPISMADYYQIKPWSEKHWEHVGEMFELLQQINQRSITTSVFWDLYNTRIRPFDEMMIQVKKLGNGTFRYDYSVFDKYVELAQSKGITGQIAVHNLFPWNGFLFYFDDATSTVQSVQTQPGTPEYQSFWKPFLLDFSEHLKRKGWHDKAILFVDERDPNMTLDLAKWVKNEFPSLKMGFAGDFYPFLSDWIEDYSMPMNVVVDAGEMKKRILSAKKTSLYTSCFEKSNQPNLLLTSDYRDIYFLTLLSRAKGYNGILRWAFNKWSSQISTNAIYADVPSGDAHFVYPDGQVSTRYLVLQDAFEEVAKLDAKSNAKQSRIMSTSLTRYFLINIEEDRYTAVQSMKNYLND
ncbi:glycoside hydrolase domain-containing protein [Algoriphagus terrigena]|uniref:glycoside hydrolase domain-containing protein n=1 Tax=Algoriphagus terrigena TaxID=344884 RepID=UPI0004191B30|nr:glycoside hydrolase domain-containing protein [Algoriphagus terrigena]